MKFTKSIFGKVNNETLNLINKMNNDYAKKLKKTKFKHTRRKLD